MKNILSKEEGYKMAKGKIEVLVEGGKANAGPPVGSSLGPLGINVSQVVADINKKTEEFKGMKVPVVIEVKEDKSYTITVGTPPISQLIKKELKIEKGSSIPNKMKIANLAIEDIIKIAKMKKDSMFVNNLKAAVKTVAGSCNSSGILIESKNSKDFNQEVDQGVYDKEINEEKTTVDEEKRKKLEESLKTFQAEMQKELDRIKALQEKEKPKEEVEEEEKKEEIKEENKKKEEKK